MDDNKSPVVLNSSFLYRSINDIQSTIRSIDTKLGFLLIFIIIPIANFDKLYSAIFPIYRENLNMLLYVLKFDTIFFIAVNWLLALICTFKGIAAIDNPAGHVKINSSKTRGIFYASNLYKKNCIDAFINRPGPVSTQSLSDYIKKLPSSNNEIIEELIFEQMKLAYIRDIKLLRQRWAFIFTFLATISAFFLCIIYM